MSMKKIILGFCCALGLIKSGYGAAATPASAATAAATSDTTATSADTSATDPKYPSPSPSSMQVAGTAPDDKEAKKNDLELIAQIMDICSPKEISGVGTAVNLINKLVDPNHALSDSLLSLLSFLVNGYFDHSPANNINTILIALLNHPKFQVNDVKKVLASNGSSYKATSLLIFLYKEIWIMVMHVIKTYTLTPQQKTDARKYIISKYYDTDHHGFFTIKQQVQNHKTIADVLAALG